MTISFADRSQDDLIVTFPFVASYRISSDTKTISYEPADDTITSETLNHLWYDQLLPRLIAHDGDLVLHGGGVVLGGQAVAIMAPTGHGKSTLTAFLHGAGHALLGDDALIVDAPDGTHQIRAVYPSLRLLPDSIDRLFGADVETQIMAQYSTKRKVAVEGLETAAPLAMMLVLAPPQPDIALHRLSVAEACMAIIANSFALNPTDKAWTVANMRRASALAASVPVFALSYPRDYDRLPDVHAAIAAQLALLDSAPPAP